MKKELTKAINKAKDVVGLDKKPNLEIQLIKGRFEPAEAADILLSFINDKIKFHTVRELNYLNEADRPESESTNRIQELKAAKKDITDLIINALKEDSHLEIESNITLTLRKVTN